MPAQRETTTPGPSRRLRALGARLAAGLLSQRWLAVGVLGASAFVLGFVGFRRYFDAAGTDQSTSDLVYLSLQLFTLESGSVPGPPWQLEVARLAAPVASATALLAALAAAFRRQIEDWRLQHERDHVVVCGLGSRGARLARELLEAGYHVVGADRNGENPSLASLRHRGAQIVIGDARDPDTLRRLRLDRATHLVCLAGDDDTNAEVALQAGDLVAERRGTALNCLSHIRDPGLCFLMRSDELATAHRRGFRLDFFNIDERAARLVLREHSPFPLADGDESAPNVIVVGATRRGESLVAEIGRQWRTHPHAQGRPIDITLVDPDATAVTERLLRRYPQLEHAARLDPVDVALDPLDTDRVATAGPGLVYVCVDGDAIAVQAALRLDLALTNPDVRIVIALEQTTGIARVIDRPPHADRLQPFDVPEQTMRPDLLLGGTYELLARAIHEEYVAEQLRQGASAETNSSVVPWERLPTSLKESNRDQAAHIGTKLSSLGCGIAPLTDWDAERTVVFGDDQIEHLAELEHERWVEQRRRDGWAPGPKDVTGRRTPYLVGWSSLSEDAKELDRQAVRGIPGFLARAGYQIVTPAR